MNDKRARMIADIQKALASAREADDPIVGHLLEAALGVAMEAERKELPAALTSILERESNRLPDIDALFAAAEVVWPARDAPRSGRAILGQDAADNVAFIRWRMPPDLEEGDEPYWARWDTDEPFDLQAWLPSPLSDDELMKIYG